MKTIIVATDYSITAQNAVEYAANLASAVHADLVIFNCFQLPVHASNSLITPNGLDEMVAYNENRLELLAVDTAKKYGIHVKAFSKMSNTIEELEFHAKALDADLVVMGMQTDLLEYKIFGNTTTAFIRRSKIPVLVVPQSVYFKGIDKILFACELTYVEENNTLLILRDFADHFKTKVQVFHVETGEKEMTPMAMDTQAIYTIDEMLEGVEHVYSYTENKDIVEGIIKGVETYQADLLAMVPHQLTFLESVIKSSITRKMTLRTRVPLLVLPNK